MQASSTGWKNCSRKRGIFSKPWSGLSQPRRSRPGKIRSKPRGSYAVLGFSPTGGFSAGLIDVRFGKNDLISVKQNPAPNYIPMAERFRLLRQIDTRRRWRSLDDERVCLL